MKIYKNNTPEYNLPDVFAKSPNSSNYKLLHINSDIEKNIAEILETMPDLLDIDKACGKNLDRYGDMFSVNRAGNIDDKYRIRIKAQIGHNYTDGSRESIASIIAWLLQCKTSDICLTGGTETGDAIVKSIPLKMLIDAGFERGEIIELINSLLAVGVKIKIASFPGTLEFADDIDEYDELKGFANENMTIGGYFGIDDNYTEV